MNAWNWSLGGAGAEVAVGVEWNRLDSVGSAWGGARRGICKDCKSVKAVCWEFLSGLRCCDGPVCSF